MVLTQLCYSISMSILRRFDPEGRPVFVTCVSHDREPHLMSNPTELLGAYRYVCRRGVSAAAWVILPDHMHAVIQPGGIINDGRMLFAPTGRVIFTLSFWERVAEGRVRVLASTLSPHSKLCGTRCCWCRL